MTTDSTLRDAHFRALLDEKAALEREVNRLQREAMADSDAQEAVYGTLTLQLRRLGLTRDQEARVLATVRQLGRDSEC